MAAKTPNLELTTREKQALLFYREHFAKYSKPPTFKQLGDYLGTWPNGARYLVNKLLAKGYLVKKKETILRLRVSEKGEKV